MTFFNIGIKILSVGVFLFFLIFGSLCYFWARMHTRVQRIIIAIIVSLLYISIIFPVGVILIALIALILEYSF